MKLVRPNKLIVKKPKFYFHYVIVDSRWILPDKGIGETGYYTYNGSEYYNKAIEILDKHKIKYYTILNYLYISHESLEVIS